MINTTYSLFVSLCDVCMYHVVNVCSGGNGACYLKVLSKLTASKVGFPTISKLLRGYCRVSTISPLSLPHLATSCPH